MTSAPGRPVSHRIVNEAFYRAVVAAGRAPSAFNAQPWRWRVSNGGLDLPSTPGDHDRAAVFAVLDGCHATAAIAPRTPRRPVAQIIE